MINYEYETAKLIIKYLKENKIIRYSRIQGIFGYIEETYFYDTEEDRANHIQEMSLKGWQLFEDNSKKSIHFNFHKQDENIYVYQACFTKRIDNDFIQWKKNILIKEGTSHC